MEQLALQQQIEMLQAQQQQILAQQQHFAQAGLLPGPPHPGLVPNPVSQPGLMGPPPNLPAPYLGNTAPFGQFTAPPPPVGHTRAHSTANPSTSSNGYNENRGPSSTGHNRRHSLALSEAKKAAALAQAKRQSGPGSPSKSDYSSTSGAHSAAMGSGTNVNDQQPGFKFPSSPDKASTASSSSPVESHMFGGASSGHSRSQSAQFPSSSRFSRQSPSSHNPPGFQFPSQEAEPYYTQARERRGSNNFNHQRSNSRNLESSNWRQPQHQQTHSSDLLSPPNTGFVPGHRSRGSFNSSISSLNSYSLYPGQLSGQGQQQGQTNRKSLFSPYLPQASLPGLLAEGRLVSGVLRVNRKNRSDAYVSTDGLLDADIFICGSKDRNRALEGDLVAVELLEVDEVWNSKKEKEEKKKRRDVIAQDDSRNESVSRSGSGAGELQRRGSLKQRPTQKKNDDVEVEGQSLLLMEEEALTDEAKPLYAGHVVAVIERTSGQMFSGTLGLLRPSSQATKDKLQAEKREKGEVIERVPKSQDKPKIVWFKPTDKRVPLIAIPTEQAPADFVENHEAYADKIFVASIKRWPITSLHPFGTLVEELGPANDLNIEIEAILRDNNFPVDQFTDAAIRSVEPEYKLGEADRTLRKNFTDEFVIGFSQYGQTSDEALHVKKLSNDRIELGIHILDVTQFLPENSALDREAKRRGTSVFLKQRTMHMLPEEFSKIASLSAGRVSPTISVVFEIDTKSFVVFDTSIVLGYVNPKQLVNLDTVDHILDEKEPELPASVSQGVADYIKTLHLLSQKFRKQRYGFGNGLTPVIGLLNQLEEDNVIVRSNIFDGSFAQQMIEEINIKANAAVAQKLYAVLGSKAFLRRHVNPVLHRLESFAETTRIMGLNIDTSSSTSILKSLFDVESEEVRHGLENVLYKCLNRAKYFVAGKVDVDNFGHYLLNIPLYTHFNAPLRRYADHIVHRQIKSVISGTEYTEDFNSLATAADNCNFKKDSAKTAQEQSLHLFLSQVINELAKPTGQIIRDAIIIQVYESAFDVLIPEFGIEKRVHGDQLPLVKAEFNKQSRLLELYWEKGIDSATFVPEDERSKRSISIDTRFSSSTASAAAQEKDQQSLDDVISRLQISGSNSEASTSSKSMPSSPALAGGESSEPFSQTPQRTSSLRSRGATTQSSDGSDALKAYLSGVVTRTEGNNYIQEIKLLQHVPVLIRSDVGKGIPCLTIRTINPFGETKS